MKDDILDMLERGASRTAGCLALLTLLFISVGAIIGGFVRFLEMLQ